MAGPFDILSEIFRTPDFEGAGENVDDIGAWLKNYVGAGPSGPRTPTTLDLLEGMSDEEATDFLNKQWLDRWINNDPASGYSMFGQDDEGNVYKEDYRDVLEEMLSIEKETGIPVNIQGMLAAGDTRKALDILEGMGLGLDNVGGGGGGGGGGGFTTYQTGTDVYVPPLVQLLTELRAKRTEDRTSAKEQLETAKTIAGAMAPDGDTFPGGAPGGLMDIFGGILSGKGQAGIKAGNDPFTGLRKPGKLPVDVQGLLERIGEREPDVSTDSPVALDLAKKMFEAALKVPRFGAVSLGGSSSGGGSSDASDLEALFASEFGDF